MQITLLHCNSRAVHANYVAGAPLFAVNWFEHMLQSLKCEEVDAGMPFLAVSVYIEILWECNHGQHGQAGLGADGLLLSINLPSHFDSPILPATRRLHNVRHLDVAQSLKLSHSSVFTRNLSNPEPVFRPRLCRIRDRGPKIHRVGLDYVVRVSKLCTGASAV